MIITCQECDSRFVLDDKLIKPAGSKVRCSSCKHVFKVYPETAAPSPGELRTPPPVSAPAVPSPPPPKAPAPRELDAGDDLADELDRELDRLFGLDGSATEEPESPPAAVKPSPPPAPAATRPVTPVDLSSEELRIDDIDLSDLDLDLSLDDEGSPAMTTGGGPVEESLDFSDLEVSLTGEDLDGSGLDGDFDFSDLGLLEGDAAPEAPPALDDELDFSLLDEALEAPSDQSGGPVSDPELELDFSDLALSLDDGPPAVTRKDEADELSLSLDDSDLKELSLGGTSELDLSLDDDLFGEAPVASGAAGAKGDARVAQDDGLLDFDLDLDLDMEEPEPVKVPMKGTLDEELDLSELEGLLKEAPDSGDALPEEEDIELELDFDFQADATTQELEPLSKDVLDESDFSDIEAMLEKDDKPLDVADELDGDVDLDFELDLAPEMEPAVSPSMGAKPKPVAVKPAVAVAGIDQAEIFDDEPDVAQKPYPRSKASRSYGSGGGAGSGLRIFLTMLLMVALLFAILVGIYALRDRIRDRTGIAIPTIGLVEQAREQVAALDIPGVSDWVRPQVIDPDGALNLITQDVTGRFVNSPSLGDLFVITGKVRNNYPTTRHSILLMGRLFTKENKEIQAKSFYAANLITDRELATLTMAQIDRRLNVALGQENMNARVSPGQVIPFMAVFAKLPDDLAEYAVEVRESKEGSALK